MLEIIESTETWAKKYGIKITTHVCRKCGILQTPSIPFAVKGFRGLISKDHGCGEGYRVSAVMPINDSDSFKELF